MEHQQYKTLGIRIKNRRKELHISQGELAEQLNISNKHMSSIENAREKPSLDLLFDICTKLKVTPDYLLLGNMHCNNVPKNIVDNLHLCSNEDIDIIKKIVEIYVNKNSTNWNNKNQIF